MEHGGLTRQAKSVPCCVHRGAYSGHKGHPMQSQMGHFLTVLTDLERTFQDWWRSIDLTVTFGPMFLSYQMLYISHGNRSRWILLFAHVHPFTMNDINNSPDMIKTADLFPGYSYTNFIQTSIGWRTLAGAKPGFSGLRI